MGELVVDDELDYNAVRIGRVQSMLRRFAVTVSGSSLDLRIHTNTYELPAGSPPAWSDGTGIYLYHNKEHDLTDVDSLIRLKGLTIHELGHVLFTPRDRTDLVKRIQSNRLWNEFNILEDNRIDNMMVARLSGVAPWLLHTVLKEFFDTPDADHTSLLPLLHGRKYVPQKIRDLSAQVYANPDNVAGIQRVIDEYITLNMARKEHQQRAYELCSELHNLLSSNDKSQHPQGYASSPSKNGGEDMAGVREQDDALQRSQKQQQQQQQDNNDSDDDSISAGGSDPAGSTAKQQLQSEIDKLGDTIQDDIYEDIKTMVKTMRGGGSGGNSGADKTVKPSAWVHLKDVETEMQIESRQFARALSELKAMYDPAWVAHQSEGRLNARDFLMGHSYDESFDLWDDSKSEVSDIECVIMLDISGSMWSNLDRAYDSMWAVKRALDSINASTTVVTFGDYSRVLYDRNSSAGIKRKHSTDGSGSTDPLSGLQYSRDLLFNSSRAIKLFIIITDGAWFEKEQSDAIISEMRMSGHLTGICHIVDQWQVDNAAERDTDFKLDGHGCEVSTIVTDPADITKFARQIVDTQQKRLLSSF